MDSSTTGIIVGGVVAGIILLILLIFGKAKELPQYKKEALWTIMLPPEEPGQPCTRIGPDGTAVFVNPVEGNTGYKKRIQNVKSTMRRGPLFFLKGPGTPLTSGINYEPILRRGYRRSSRKSVRKH